MKFRISYIFLIITLISLFFTGLDFTHHAHNSWLYYEMINNWDYMSTDPYFASQITYAYGVPAYALAGLLWFIFDINTIDFLVAIMIIVNYIVLLKWFKNDDKWVSILTLLNIFFTIFDAYVAAFSNCLFWLASYAYFNKKKWWPIPLLIAAFNHPYVLISSLLFAVKVPILIAPMSLILTYFLLASQVFSTETFLPIYTMFMGLARIIVNLLPILILTGIGKINKKDLKILRDFAKYRIRMSTVLICILIIGTLAAVLTIYVLVLQTNPIIDPLMYEGMPEVNGTLRAVDYLYLPSVYVLPSQGYNLEAGSFRENNPQHLIKSIWENNTEYTNYVLSTNVSYVLFCKMCNPQSNELDMLRENHELIWDNEYYYLFKLNQ